MRRIAFLACTLAAIACGSTEPARPYTVAGTWDGTGDVSQPAVHFEFSQSTDRVGGSGWFHHADGDTVRVSLAGTLRDSTLSVEYQTLGVYAGASGTIGGIYRAQESNAGSFHATMSGVGFDGMVTRR